MNELLKKLKKEVKIGHRIIGLVAFFGLIGYGILLCSFAEISLPFNLQHVLTIHANEGLNHYATVVAGLLGSAVTTLGLSFLIYAYWSQKSQSQFEAFNKLYENLLEDINSIQYRKKYKRVLRSPDDSQLFEGVDALFHYECDDNDTKSSVLNHLSLILISFKRISEMLEDEDSRIANCDLLLDKIYLLFLAKIYWPCDRISIHYRQQIIDLDWGYPKTLFYHLDFMTNKAYRHLLKEGIIALHPIEVKRNPNVPFAAELHKALYATYGKSDEDTLGPNVRSVMKCCYDTVDTYWDNPPNLIDNYALPSQLRNVVTFFCGKSATTDSIMASFDQGVVLRARHAFARSTTAFKDFVQFFGSKAAKNPSGCL